MNRGLAHRPVFESRRDMRLFLSLLARKVREGRIEVHAFSLLTTHYHLLLRSPRGELSDVMMWVTNQYVRRFNRRRGRDGSLFRGRFRSRLVDSEAYWYTLIRYIDRNAVEAGMVRSASDYPFCSAHFYAQRRGPRWLTRGEIERAAALATGIRDVDSRTYELAFGSELEASEAWLVERRIERGAFSARLDAVWDDLVGSAPERVRAELLASVHAADGRRAPAPVVDPSTALRIVADERGRAEEWSVGDRRRRRNLGWRTAEVGILREACGLTLSEVGHRLSADAHAVGRAAARHRHLVAADANYALRFAALLRAVLRTAPRARPVSGVFDKREK